MITQSERHRLCSLDVHAFASRRFDDLLSLSGEQLWERLDGVDTAFPLIAEHIQPATEDTVLDVGCGAGIMACSLSRSVASVVGVDLVPEMLDVAAALARAGGATNVEWRVADVPPIPFDDGRFSVVTTRLCLHHTRDPEAIVAEMARVCRRDGGRVVIVDEVSAADAAEALRYNDWERNRDPSHVRFLAVEEHCRAMEKAGLAWQDPDFFVRELDLDEVLANSFPRDGFGDAMAALKARAIDEQCLFGLRQEEGRWLFNTVDMVLVGRPR